ncbi:MULTISPECIES: universal stress protein [Halococcus]|uniref:UspA domain-containing protein n=2 Tax=Halococcus salifodinae TaxID=36738 RepID=M0MWF2_9EURY|nr:MULTISPECIES: universal stress protein [Halococcus]EMA50047.1 UspA domain-containing protein [Halococcus salifodinae DSM 8989]
MDATADHDDSNSSNGVNDAHAPGTPFDVTTVLVPVDGSDESMHAVEYAVAVAERYGARVHALYVLDPEMVRRDAPGEPDDDAIAAASEGFMDAARDLAAERVELTHSSAYGFSPTMKSRHPGSVVLDAAADAEVDFVVVPREPGGEANELLGRAAEYVLQYATEPVLSV